jgi:hypothetical protein
MRRIAGIVACLVVAVTPSARASHGPIDTLIVLNNTSSPVLALDPASGDRHAAYLSNNVLLHGWESPGGWQSEAITDSASLTTFSGFQLRLASDGHPVAAYVRSGALVCAIRGPDGWQRDTLDRVSGSFLPVALALNPNTGEPSVAWTKQAASSASPSEVFYARHGGGAWTTELVDTVSRYWPPLSLAIDGVGRPHLAWARPREDNSQNAVLTYAMGAGPGGPFASTPVDSELYVFADLQIDRSNGEPRIVYDALTGSSIRYAFRGIGGAWLSQQVRSTPPFNNNAPALALDPSGNPFVSYREVVPIEPQTIAAADPDQTEACGSAFSNAILVYQRAGGAGFGSFTLESIVNPPPTPLMQCSFGAVASRTNGQAVVAWRTPGTNICPPLALATCLVTIPSLVGVGGSDGAPGLALAPIWPNPARPGDGLRVAFGLPRAAAVSLELHDLAGRRVAARAAAPMTAGPQSIAWSVPNLGPGLYWLTVRIDGGRIGTRSVVILR